MTSSCSIFLNSSQKTRKRESSILRWTIVSQGHAKGPLGRRDVTCIQTTHRITRDFLSEIMEMLARLWVDHFTNNSLAELLEVDFKQNKIAFVLDFCPQPLSRIAPIQVAFWNTVSKWTFKTTVRVFDNHSWRDPLESIGISFDHKDRMCNNILVIAGDRLLHDDGGAQGDWKQLKVVIYNPAVDPNDSIDPPQTPEEILGEALQLPPGPLPAPVAGRVGVANAAYIEMSRTIFRNRHLKPQTRLQLLESLVFTKLFYAMAIWVPIPTKEWNTLDRFVMKLIRKTLGIKHDEGRTNESIRLEYSLPLLDHRLARARLQYAAQATDQP